ncbi:MAG TPA: hypothetical protein VF062_29460 [Candidatus Limnocylindrales bacterium]
MIWLTWRQHRKQVWFTLAALAGLAALMVPTGLSMRAAFDDLKVGDCLARMGTAQLVPVETTAWTQGISRRRWALVKFGLVGGTILTASVVYGLGMSWWLEPLMRAGQSRLNLVVFDMQGIAPIGYTLFAVALGVFAGTVWPKVLPAMAATLVGVAALRIALTTLARRHYRPAETLTFPVVGTGGELNPGAGDWVLGRGIRDASGQMVLQGTQVSCSPDATNCAAEMGLGEGAYNWILLQPAARFWPFQIIEFGIYTALAVVLLVLAVRRVRRIA